MSAEFKAGTVCGVRILSEKGRDCTLVNPWPGKTVTVERDGKPAETVQGDRFTVKTRSGECLTLTP